MCYEVGTPEGHYTEVILDHKCERPWYMREFWTKHSNTIVYNSSRMVVHFNSILQIGLTFHNHQTKRLVNVSEKYSKSKSQKQSGF